MNDLFREVDRMLESMFYSYPSDIKPPTAIELVDNKDLGKLIRIQMALAGFSKADVKVWHKGGTLFISGDNKGNKAVKVCDRFTMTFERKFTLSNDADLASADVKLENGLLTIDIPFASVREEKTLLFGTPNK